MEQVITSPHQWGRIRNLYKPPYVHGSEEYRVACAILNDLEEKIKAWEKCHFFTTRRIPEKKKVYYRKLNREYLAYYNKQLNECSQITLLLRLKA